MTREAIEALFTARAQLLRRHDSAGLAKAHAENCIVESPIFGLVRGRAAIEESYASLFRAFADSTFEQEGIVIDEAQDQVVALFKWHATHTNEMFGIPPSGRRFTIHGVLVYQLENGHIVHERRIYDFTGLLIQIGVLKPRPS
ncbi:MAG TPA: ester cyclase [Vicinamibacterales bacterium]|nr:ester cyclase [Vicinamibacterales bacterium]